MATIVLAAAGTALGTSVGGTVLGLSTAAIGRAAGATLGRVIDQRLLGSGSDAVETGRIDRFRLNSAGEGAPIGQVHGRMRVPGQVIWSTRFLEDTATTGGGKGTRGPSVTEYSYSVSIAVALCEGQITRVGRVWADGVEVAPESLNMRVYQGADDQVPDPKISAVEGAAQTPAYRGLAYVVMEDLPLGPFGNRVPQFSFEVFRPDISTDPEVSDLTAEISAVALIPGSGEYSLATTPAYFETDFGEMDAVNQNTASWGTDFDASMTALSEELPRVGSGLLVVSWFGDDLRCGACSVQPKIEQADFDPEDSPWRVSGETRSTAAILSQKDGRPVYGGTPTDQSVIEAIAAMKAKGIGPVFYPFILMEQGQGNGLPNPYDPSSDQPLLPWRGRITTALAPGVPGSSDGTASAKAEVQSFLGSAMPSDFDVDETRVTYTGPQDFGYRRFILHYAHLCAAAGGVDAFCIGSELRGLTQIRDDAGFPFVEALKQLASDVRLILGPECKISYAADWSEYHGYQPAGTADKLFHLDPLWADPNIDFIGIDNYMPLSDWRDTDNHADAAWGSVYNLDYLSGNIEGGEGYDWYYASDTARDAQRRTEITDGDGEPWVWRYKDLKNWWSHPHHNRIDGVRQETPTPWQPESKPIWFTEYGCAAIDKGTNQPNKFLDPKSSESQLPHYSTGQRDDFLQLQYYKAFRKHYSDPANNPVSSTYQGPMVDMARAHAWAWDVRPFPQFPGNAQRWSDGANYTQGHWLNGRTSARTLASVVSEICMNSGLYSIDTHELYGLVRGYHQASIESGRAGLQPLLLAYGIDVSETNGTLVFKSRKGQKPQIITKDQLAYDPELASDWETVRASAVENDGRVQVEYLEAEGSYDIKVAESAPPGGNGASVSRSQLALCLTSAEANGIVGRWGQEGQLARDTIRFALPPSGGPLQVGDVVTIKDGPSGHFRLDQIQEDGLRKIEATRVDTEVYESPNWADAPLSLAPQVGPTPAKVYWLDLPAIDGADGLQMPYIAAAARPWPGSIATYGSTEDSNYVLQGILRRQHPIGILETDMTSGPVARWDRQEDVIVNMISGSFSSATPSQVLSGSNMLAIGDGSANRWEIVQFRYADPLENRKFTLRHFLRGQFGTGATTHPSGSIVVVLEGLEDRFTVPNLGPGTMRNVRYGPAKRSFDDPSYRSAVHDFDGISLRPYPVCHLKMVAQGNAHGISWVRQTRIGGGDWIAPDVPLAEEAETYTIEVRQGGHVLRSIVVTEPSWTYDQAARIVDGTTAGYQIAVAQNSVRFGPGPFQSLDVAG